MSIFIRFLLFIPLSVLFSSAETESQSFQGKAYYFSKSKMDLGNWGARMSEVQKKQMKNRLKNRLDKTYILSFNNTESLFIEEEKVDAISGATDSWGSNFARGKQYKNIAENSLVQAQEFYGVHSERPFFGELCEFMASAPIVAQVLEGEGAIVKNREVMGATNPADAAAGTIRAEFAESVGENSVHGSDAPETAATEIAYFFSGLELVG